MTLPETSDGEDRENNAAASNYAYQEPRQSRDRDLQSARGVSTFPRYSVFDTSGRSKPRVVEFSLRNSRNTFVFSANQAVYLVNVARVPRISIRHRLFDTHHIEIHNFRMESVVVAETLATRKSRKLIKTLTACFVRYDILNDRVYVHVCVCVCVVLLTIPCNHIKDDYFERRRGLRNGFTSRAALSIGDNLKCILRAFSSSDRRGLRIFNLHRERYVAFAVINISISYKRVI